MSIARFSGVLSVPLLIQACSFNLPVPENYHADNTDGCSVTVEDVRSAPESVSFGRSALVSKPALSDVLLREACSRDSLRHRPMTIRITSAFCDTGEWAMDAYAEVHARVWLDSGNQLMNTMRKGNGSAVGTAPSICGNILWPLAPQLMDDIEVQVKGLSLPIAADAPLSNQSVDS